MIIMKNIELTESGFYFEFGFDICKSVGLVYDYNFSYINKYTLFMRRILLNLFK